MLHLVPALLAVTALGAPVRGPAAPSRPPAHVLAAASVGGVGGVVLTSTAHRVAPAPAGPVVAPAGRRGLLPAVPPAAAATSSPVALAATIGPWIPVGGRRRGPDRASVAVTCEARAAPWRPG